MVPTLHLSIFMTMVLSYKKGGLVITTSPPFFLHIHLSVSHAARYAQRGADGCEKRNQNLKYKFPVFFRHRLFRLVIDNYVNRTGERSPRSGGLSSRWLHPQSRHYPRPCQSANRRQWYPRCCRQ